MKLNNAERVRNAWDVDEHFKLDKDALHIEAQFKGHRASSSVAAGHDALKLVEKVRDNAHTAYEQHENNMRKLHSIADDITSHMAVALK